MTPTGTKITMTARLPLFSTSSGRDFCSRITFKFLVLFGFEVVLRLLVSSIIVYIVLAVILCTCVIAWMKRRICLRLSMSHSRVTRIRTHRFFGRQTSHPDPWRSFPTDHPDPQVKNPWVNRYPQVFPNDGSSWVLTSIPMGTHIKKAKNHKFQYKNLTYYYTIVWIWLWYYLLLFLGASRLILKELDDVILRDNTF